MRIPCEELVVAESARLFFIGVVEKAGEDVSRVRLFPEFYDGIFGLEVFSHVIVLYWCHLRDNANDRRVLRVIPKRHPGAPETGVFGSRSPSRPNPIALAVCELVRVEGPVLLLKGLDALEGTPIVDIKPYLPRADSVPSARVPKWFLHGPSA